MDWGEFGKNIIGKKMIVLLSVTGAVYFFLQYLTPLLAPVLLAMLFVTIFGPMMKRMNRKLHFPRPLSAIVLLILATLLLAVLLWVLSSWVLGSLPVWIRSMDAREQEWLEVVRNLCRSVGEIIGVDASYLENTVSGQTAGGTGFAGGKYSAGDAVAIHAVCAVVCGAGRIPGDISHCVGTVGERL